jgi:putative mRNA 3-end processing factor
MIALSSKGVIYENSGYKILFDPTRKISGIHPYTCVCISHAHSDHIRNHGVGVHVTQATAELGNLKGINKMEYGKSARWNEFELSAHDAGHILGSAQFRVYDGKESVVYTGDFKLQESLLFNGGEIVDADTLILESTFGTPEFRFPPREEVYSNMENWVKSNYENGRIVVLGGYRMGKAQELTKLVSESCGITPIVHPSIDNVNWIYESYQTKLGEWVSGESEEASGMMRDGSFVFITAPHRISHSLLEAMRVQFGRKVVSAVATGWAMLPFTRNGADRMFPLSDHADYPQLMEYVEESNPKRVLTHHGYAEELARRIWKKLHIKARPLKPKTEQVTLEAF